MSYTSKISILILLFTFLFSISSVSSQTTDGLIGHWKFDGNGNNEVSGGTAAATVGSAVFKTDGGKLGGYLYIPTGSDSAKIPYSNTYDLPTSWTIEFWFRQRSDQSFAQDLVYKGSGTNNYNFKIFRQLWNQYNFGPVIVGYTALNTGYWSQSSNSNQLAHNEWHHVAYTRDSSKAIYYLDGALINSLDLNQYPEYSGNAKTPAVDIIIGDTAVDTDIDNLRIYNKALSFSEVASNGGFSAPICTPNTHRCNGNSIEQCNSAGSAWTNSQSCGIGTCDAATNSCKYPSQTPSLANLCNSTYVGCGNQTSCSGAGGNWCGSFCQSGACSSGSNTSTQGSPTPLYTHVAAGCSTGYVKECHTSGNCMTVGGYWCSLPNGTYECLSTRCLGAITPTQTSSPTPVYTHVAAGCSTGYVKECHTRTNCETVDGNWCRLSNGTYECTDSSCARLVEQESNQCNTDQDCAWQITNGCAESAGANWECESLLARNSRSSGVCPQVFSPKPAANCGCVQNKCIVYQDNRPTELPRTIGNTSVDETFLLSAVIQLEQLKIKFEFLKAATTRLSDYYNSTGDSDSAERWAEAATILQEGIDKVEKLKKYIRDKLDTFTVDNLRELKSEIKSIRSILKHVLRAALGLTSTPEPSPLQRQNQTVQQNITPPNTTILPSPARNLANLANQTQPITNLTNTNRSTTTPNVTITPVVTPTTTPTPTYTSAATGCSTGYVTECHTQANCNTVGGNWCGLSNGTSECKSTPCSGTPTPTPTFIPPTIEGTFAVTSPNGGESYKQNNAYTIAWNNPIKSSFSGDKNMEWEILFYKNGELYWTPLVYSPITASSQSLTVSQGLGNSTEWKVRVILLSKCRTGREYDPAVPCPKPNEVLSSPVLSDGKIGDESDNKFTCCI